MNKGLLRFFPVTQKSLKPDVGQRMLNQFLENLKGHGGDVRSKLGRLQDMHRVADAGYQNFRLKTIIGVDRLDISDDIHPNLAYVIQAADKGADVRGPALGGQKGLRRRKAEGDIDPDLALAQDLKGLEPFGNQRDFDDDVRCDLDEFLRLLQHPLTDRRHNLRAHGTFHNRTDLRDEVMELPSFFTNQRRVGRDAIENPQLIRLANFL